MNPKPHVILQLYLKIDPKKNHKEPVSQSILTMKQHQQNNYLFTIYRDIKGEQEISRDFFLPRPSETFLIILHHELASDARLPKKSRGRSR